MNLISPNAVFDDYTTDYDWSTNSNQYPEHFSLNCIEFPKEEEMHNKHGLQLADVYIDSLNQDKKVYFQFTFI